MFRCDGIQRVLQPGEHRIRRGVERCWRVQLQVGDIAAILAGQNGLGHLVSFPATAQIFGARDGWRKRCPS